MSADPPDEELGEMDVELDSVLDWFEVEGGYIIACRGFADVQDHFGCPLVRIKMKAPGTVEGLVSDDEGQTWAWKSLDKLKVTAELKAIKS